MSESNATEAAEKPEEESQVDENVDEDGIQIQTYRSRVLLVVPETDFAEETMRYVRSCLYNVHVGTFCVSTQTEEEIKGRLQDEFLVDGHVSEATLDEFTGVVFVGGEGALALAENADAQRLAREAMAGNKLLGAFGHAMAVLAQSGVVRGKKVTAPPFLKDKIQSAGGKWTGRELEPRGNLVTARDDAVGMRFGRALAQVVGI